MTFWFGHAYNTPVCRCVRVAAARAVGGYRRVTFPATACATPLAYRAHHLATPRHRFPLLH